MNDRLEKSSSNCGVSSESTEVSTTDVLLSATSQSPSQPPQLKKRVKVYPEKPHRVRAKKPKSRNGCKTCKIRRVKCDEGKPNCQKCRKFGVVCDGYTNPQQPASSRKALLPNQNCGLNISILPVTALFDSPDEYQYFLYFRDELLHDLSGHALDKCWNYVVLQACNETTALRNLTVAIAALSKSKYLCGTSQMHHTFAVHQYGKALRGIQKIVSTRTDVDALRIVLIASLLIFCFESIHGNQDQAIAHAVASLSLMRKRLPTSTCRWSQIQPLSSIPGLEDAILEIFIRLDNIIMSRVGHPHSSRRTSILEVSFVSGNFYMPPAFQNFIEAKTYLEHFQFHAMPYLSRLTDVFLYGEKYACPIRDNAYENLTLQLRPWYNAFKPLFDRAMRPGDKDFISAATIYCIALSTDISFQRVCLKPADCPKELFEAEVRLIIDLTRKVVMDHRFKKTFSFDCGVVPSLFIAIMICRNREIREEAIEILRLAGDRVETTWVAKDIMALGERMMQAEEQGMSVFTP